MATGYTTVSHDETVSINTSRGFSAQFTFTYTVPAGKRWLGTAYATYASDDSDAAPSGAIVGDGARVSDDGQTALARVTVEAPSGYVSNSPLAVHVKVAAIDA